MIAAAPKLYVYAHDPMPGGGDRLAKMLGGCAVGDWQGTASETPLVVLFSAPVTNLVELVQAASGAGERLVIAVEWGQRLPGTFGWELLRAGAADVLAGTDPERLAGQVAARVGHWLAREARLADPALADRCVGGSPAWRRLMREVVEATGDGTAPVLLHGESGTGKEVVARLLHDLGGSARGPMVTVDCTTIVRELSGSELFGHVRGAFTGAHADREGAFAAADGGTLFLDEIGDLPPSLQPELLRVVQEGTYKAVGSNAWHRARFRLIAATHHDLARETTAGRFRLDLYHRLTGWFIRLPPLRDRLSDVPDLVRHFLREFGGDHPPGLSDEVWSFLREREYPGNVRDLRNVVRRLVLRRAGSSVISLGCVAEEDRPTVEAGSGWLSDLEAATARALAGGVTMKELANHARECMVRAAVLLERGSLQRAAKRLGVTDRALQIRAAGKRGAAAAE